MKLLTVITIIEQMCFRTRVSLFSFLGAAQPGLPFLQSSSSTTLNVAWNPSVGHVDPFEGQVDFYLLDYLPEVGSSANPITVPTEDGASFVLRKLLPGEDYTVSVKAVAGLGTDETVSASSTSTLTTGIIIIGLLKNSNIAARGLT